MDDTYETFRPAVLLDDLTPELRAIVIATVLAKNGCIETINTRDINERAA